MVWRKYAKIIIYYYYMITMNTYEQVKKIVEAGKIAIGVNKSWWKTYFNYVMSNWHIRWTHSTKAHDWEYPLKPFYTMDSLGKVEYTRSEINTFTYGWVYIQQLRRPKVWDIVNVLNTIMDVKNYNWMSSEKKEKLKHPLEVVELMPSWCSVRSGWSSPFWVSYEHLVPHVMIKERSEKIYVYWPDWKKYLLVPVD